MCLCIAGAPSLDALALPIGAMIEDGDFSLSAHQPSGFDLGAAYREHRETMFRVAARVLGGAETASRSMSAEDVVHRVMRRLLENGLESDVQDLRSYLLSTAPCKSFTSSGVLTRGFWSEKPSDDLRGAVLRAVRNEAVDVLRRAKQVTTDECDKLRTPREEPLSDTFAGSLVDDSADADVESFVLELLFQERAREHLDVLTENQRRAIVGRVFETRSAREVAADLNVSPQRVPQLVRAGAVRLLRAMGELKDNHDRPT